MTIGACVLAAICLYPLPDGSPDPPQGSSRKPALTLGQVEQLVAAGVPDGTIAKEVAGRGVREDVTRARIDALRSKGAGPQTAAALAALIARATLVLRTTPGAQILLAGRPAGSSSESGEFTRSDLEPGRVRLLIRKAHHVPRDQEIELRTRGATTLDLPLEWAVGFLTLRPEQAQARIEIEGVGSYHRQVEALALAPGEYRVTVSAPSFEPVTRAVTIVAGQTASPEVTMVFDRQRLAEFKSQLNTAFGQGRYAHAVSVAREMEQAGILETDGLSIAATSHFELRNYTAFLEMARKVLAQRGEVRVAVIHHHRLLVPSHAALLSIGPGEVRFLPQDMCTLKSFTVEASEIHVRSRAILGADNSNLIGLGFDYPNAKNPRKKETVFFIMREEPQKAALAELLAEAGRAVGSTP